MSVIDASSQSMDARLLQNHDLEVWRLTSTGRAEPSDYFENSVIQYPNDVYGQLALKFFSAGIDYYKIKSETPGEEQMTFEYWADIVGEDFLSGSDDAQCLVEIGLSGSNRPSIECVIAAGSVALGEDRVSSDQDLMRIALEISAIQDSDEGSMLTGVKFADGAEKIGKLYHLPTSDAAEHRVVAGH